MSRGRQSVRAAARRPGAHPERSERPERRGHRREHDPRRERQGFAQRRALAMDDLGIYRCAAFADIAAERFGGHPYAARRGIDQLKRQGLVAEFDGRGPKGKPFKVLHLTAAGKRAAGQARAGGLADGQRYWGGRAKAREASHEAAVYRAGREECRRLASEGCSVRRIRCDSELKSAVARVAERARARSGSEAAERAKREAAQALDLPVEGGKVLYPDLQIEYADGEGALGRVNIEVATGNYRAGDIAAKAAAGFRMHGADAGARSKIVAALGGGGRKGLNLGDLEGRGGGGGGGWSDEGLLEL